MKYDARRPGERPFGLGDVRKKSRYTCAGVTRDTMFHNPPKTFWIWLLYVVAAVGVITTILPFVPLDHWIFRAAEFPRLQVMLICLASVVGILSIPGKVSSAARVTIALAGAATLYQAAWILPYTQAFPVEVARQNKGETVKLLIVNVLMENRDTDRLLALIREEEPDVVLLAEPDGLWIRALAPLSETYPHRLEEPLGNAYGMALYSKLPLVDPKIRYLIEEGVPSMKTDLRLSSGRTIRLFGVHPKPPFPGESQDSTERDAELIVTAREVAETKIPAIVAGDLNDVAWSSTTHDFKEVSGMLDPRIGRGFYNSFHAGHWYVRFPLDHVFVTNEFTLVELRRLRNIGSDHFPIMVTLAL